MLFLSTVLLITMQLLSAATSRVREPRIEPAAPPRPVEPALCARRCRAGCTGTCPHRSRNACSAGPGTGGPALRRACAKAASAAPAAVRPSFAGSPLVLEPESAFAVALRSVAESLRLAREPGQAACLLVIGAGQGLGATASAIGLSA